MKASLWEFKEEMNVGLMIVTNGSYYPRGHSAHVDYFTEGDLLPKEAEFQILCTTHEPQKRSKSDLHQEPSDEARRKLRVCSILATRLRTAVVL